MNSIPTTTLHSFTLTRLEDMIAKVRDAHGAALSLPGPAYELLTDHYRDLQAVRSDLLAMVRDHQPSTADAITDAFAGAPFGFNA